MFYRRGIIPRRLEELWGLSPVLAEAFAERNVALARFAGPGCADAGAAGRARALPGRLPPAPACSLARWVEQPGARALRIAEINRIDGLHEHLSRLPHLSWSDYDSGLSPEPTGPAHPLRGPDAFDLRRRILRPHIDVRITRARARARTGAARNSSCAGPGRPACFHHPALAGSFPDLCTLGRAPRRLGRRPGAADLSPGRRLGISGLHRIRSRPAGSTRARDARPSSLSVRRARMTWPRSSCAGKYRRRHGSLEQFPPPQRATAPIGVDPAGVPHMKR